MRPLFLSLFFTLRKQVRCKKNITFSIDVRKKPERQTDFSSIYLFTTPLITNQA